MFPGSGRSGRSPSHAIPLDIGADEMELKPFDVSKPIQPSPAHNDSDDERIITFTDLKASLPLLHRTSVSNRSNRATSTSKRPAPEWRRHSDEISVKSEPLSSEWRSWRRHSDEISVKAERKTPEGEWTRHSGDISVKAEPGATPGPAPRFVDVDVEALESLDDLERRGTRFEEDEEESEEAVRERLRRRDKAAPRRQHWAERQREAKQRQAEQQRIADDLDSQSSVRPDSMPSHNGSPDPDPDPPGSDDEPGEPRGPPRPPRPPGRPRRRRRSSRPRRRRAEAEPEDEDEYAQQARKARERFVRSEHRRLGGGVPRWHHGLQGDFQVNKLEEEKAREAYLQTLEEQKQQQNVQLVACDHKDDLRCAECRRNGIITCFRVAMRGKCEPCRKETARMGRTITCSLHELSAAQGLNLMGGAICRAVRRDSAGEEEARAIFKNLIRQRRLYRRGR